MLQNNSVSHHPGLVVILTDPFSPVSLLSLNQTTVDFRDSTTTVPFRMQVLELLLHSVQQAFSEGDDVTSGHKTQNTVARAGSCKEPPGRKGILCSRCLWEMLSRWDHIVYSWRHEQAERKWLIRTCREPYLIHTCWYCPLMVLYHQRKYMGAFIYLKVPIT